MQQPGQLDINETISAWADIVIEKWRAKITELKVFDQGYLYDSFLIDMVRNAGADIDKLEFSFKLYGIFVDMGVGREISRGNSGDLGFTPVRKPKEWFSKKYYGQVMKLRELLIEKYSKSITAILTNMLTEPIDQRYANPMKAPTVESLRTVRYRAQQNIRNARNYAARRNKPGQWKNDYKTWKPD